MKISLAWIFDHIDADWQTIDVDHLVSEFNKKTAEIDNYYAISLNLDMLTLVVVQEVAVDSIVVFSKELNSAITLPRRTDAREGALFLLASHNSQWHWASNTDLHGQKEGLVPALSCPDFLLDGSWKKQFETEDWIVDVDNKSINHRPDLWGHRGIARECALLLDLPFKPLTDLCASLNVEQYEKKVASNGQPFSIAVENRALCKRFAILYIPHIDNKPSDIFIAHRLIKVESKPISAIVDVTNYVMFDIGQPMHAFDAARIAGRSVYIRNARAGEKITLLDGDTISLFTNNLVISDAQKPIALAGIMGGRSTAVEYGTDAVVLEAACFDSASIRKTSFEVKKRTDACARFEKSLDPNQNVDAIKRFVQLALEQGLIDKDKLGPLISFGSVVQEISIAVSHAYIEERLGATIEPSFVVSTLEKLGFTVLEDGGMYHIGVPTYRSTKDAVIKQDIVEEVGRIYGYDRIEPQFPMRAMKPFDMSIQEKIRLIKQTMAYGLSLKELYQYAFFDEQFLNEIKWDPTHTLEVQSPVSENWKRLVTSLLPGLLKAVIDHAPEHDQLRFFELARIWRIDKTLAQEKQMLAAIMFNKKEPISFYEAKAQLSVLFHALDITVAWKRVEVTEYPWFAPYQTAQLFHKKSLVGTAGNVDKSFLSMLTPGDAFLCELDADFLLSYKPSLVRYAPVSKYPAVERDISMLVPYDCTAALLSERIKKVDDRIVSVALVDFFEKDEWDNQKSITFRFVLSDLHKTLTKHEVDLVWDRIAADMKTLGAVIR